MVSIGSLVMGKRGLSGFGSASTAEEVTEGIDACNLTVVTIVRTFIELRAFHKCRSCSNNGAFAHSFFLAFCCSYNVRPENVNAYLQVDIFKMNGSSVVDLLMPSAVSYAHRLRSMVVAVVPKLAQAAEYFFRIGVEGKRFRPTVLLLMAKALQMSIPQVHNAQLEYFIA